jgi:hypothetical protein
MITGWTIWCQRNASFDGAAASHRRWKEAYKDEFTLIIHRAKPSTKSPLKSCLSSFSQSFWSFSLGLQLQCTFVYTFVSFIN